MAKKMLFVGLVLMLVITGGLVACTKEAPTTPAPTTQAPAPAPTTPAPAPTTPSPQYGGTLKIATMSDAQELGNTGSFNALTIFMQKPAIETLGRMDAAANIEPWLAESWQIDMAAKTFTVKLKKGIKFHDGTDFNAAAVKWNWERMQAARSPFTMRIASIDMVDDYTVRANLNAPDNSIVIQLCFDGGSMASPTAWQKNGAEWGQKNPVGTGPFQFVSWEREKGVTYKKWAGYWQQGKPYLDGIEFVIIADPVTAAMAFKNGEVDILWDTQPTEASDLKKTGKYNVVNLTTGIQTTEFVLIPGSAKTESPLANATVRQAIDYAINKQTIVDNLLSGYGTVATQWGLPTNWNYNPDYKGHPYNPAKAKELLAEAGYPNGFSTTIITDPPKVQIMETIQPMLDEVGIKVKVQTETVLGILSYIQKGWDGMLGIQLAPDGDVAYRTGFYFASTSPLMGGIAHPVEIDNAVNAALGANDFKTKQQLTWKLQELLFGKLTHFIPIAVQDLVAPKWLKVHDDGIALTAAYQWTPENAWIAK